MAKELLSYNKTKDNSRKKGIPAQKLEQRQVEARERQDSYSKLTVAQKVARLDAGNFTASKQRSKLEKT